jgi:hypothetical protein
MVVDRDFEERVKECQSEAIQRAYQRLVTAPAQNFVVEAANMARTIMKCCEARPTEKDQLFAPLLVPAFNLSLSFHGPFEYEFCGDEEISHKVKCSAAVLQRVGWDVLSVHAQRWCKILMQSFVGDGMPVPIVRNLIRAKTYAAFLCADLLPMRNRESLEV